MTLHRLGPGAPAGDVAASLDEHGRAGRGRARARGRRPAPGGATDLFAATPTGRNFFEGFHTQRIYAVYAKTRAFDDLAVHPAAGGARPRPRPPLPVLGAGGVADRAGREGPGAPPRRGRLPADPAPRPGGGQQHVGALRLHRGQRRHPARPRQPPLARRPPAHRRRGHRHHARRLGADLPGRPVARRRRQHDRRPRPGLLLEYVVSWLRPQETQLVAVPPEWCASCPSGCRSCSATTPSPVPRLRRRPPPRRVLDPASGRADDVLRRIPSPSTPPAVAAWSGDDNRHRPRRGGAPSRTSTGKPGWRRARSSPPSWATIATTTESTTCRPEPSADTAMGRPACPGGGARRRRRRRGRRWRRWRRSERGRPAPSTCWCTSSTTMRGTDLRLAEMASDQLDGVHAELLVNAGQLNAPSPSTPPWPSSAPGSTARCWTRRPTGSARLAAGRTPARINIERSINQVEGYLASTVESDPFANLRGPEGWDGLDAWRAELAGIVRDAVRPAFAAYRDVLRDELLPVARPDDRPGLVHLDDGPGHVPGAGRDAHGPAAHPGRAACRGHGRGDRGIAGRVRRGGRPAVRHQRPPGDLRPPGRRPRLRYRDGDEITGPRRRLPRGRLAAMGDWFGITPRPRACSRPSPTTWPRTRRPPTTRRPRLTAAARASTTSTCTQPPTVGGRDRGHGLPRGHPRAPPPARHRHRAHGPARLPPAVVGPHRVRRGLGAVHRAAGRRDGPVRERPRPPGHAGRRLVACRLVVDTVPHAPVDPPPGHRLRGGARPGERAEIEVEVDRYIGIPARHYKVGKRRSWLRAEARAHSAPLRHQGLPRRRARRRHGQPAGAAGAGGALARRRRRALTAPAPAGDARRSPRRSAAAPRSRRVHQAGQYRADQWRQPEQPELLDRPPAHEHRRAGRPGRVHRRVGDRDADEVDEGERQADGQRGEARGALARDPEDDGRKKNVSTTSATRAASQS